MVVSSVTTPLTVVDVISSMARVRYPYIETLYRDVISSRYIETLHRDVTSRYPYIDLAVWRATLPQDCQRDRPG